MQVVAIDGLDHIAVAGEHLEVVIKLLEDIAVEPEYDVLAVVSP